RHDPPRSAPRSSVGRPDSSFATRPTCELPGEPALGPVSGRARRVGPRSRGIAQRWYCLRSMSQSHRFRRAGFGVAGCLLVLACAAVAAAPAPPAQKPAKSTPHTAPVDSVVPESPPGKLLVPPHIAPGTALPSPEDTARAGARRRAHDEYVRGLALERDGAYAAAIVSYPNAARTDPARRGAALPGGVPFGSKTEPHAA